MQLPSISWPPILFWLLAHGARPRRHDAAFVVVAVVVRSTLMLTLLLWLSWTNQKSGSECILTRNAWALSQKP